MAMAKLTKTMPTQTASIPGKPAMLTEIAVSGIAMVTDTIASAS